MTTLLDGSLTTISLPLPGSEEPMSVATNVASVGNMMVEPRTGALYFTNPQRGTVEMIRPDQPGSNVLYRGLDNPTTLSLQDG